MITPISWRLPRLVELEIMPERDRIEAPAANSHAFAPGIVRPQQNAPITVISARANFERPPSLGLGIGKAGGLDLQHPGERHRVLAQAPPLMAVFAIQSLITLDQHGDFFRCPVGRVYDLAPGRKLIGS